jgi:glutaredoxin 2
LPKCGLARLFIIHHSPFCLHPRVVFRFTVIWESMIVIIREKRAKVIEIMWERVEPRAA